MLIGRPSRLMPMYFAFKIKDGLFIGDGQSPNQLDFLLANKIGTIINCAASEVTITHQLQAFRVVNFSWLDSDEQVILDQSDSNFDSVCYFIDDAHAKHEGVLICSMRGQSRALTIITAYLIKKYKWSLYKTLEYLNSKRNDFEIRANFLKQLVQLQTRLFGKKLKNCTKNWDEHQIEHDGQIVKNTYLNSLSNQATDKKPQNARHKEKMHSTSKNKKSVKFDDFAVIINNAAQQEQQQERTPYQTIQQPSKSKHQLNILELNRVIEKQIMRKDPTPIKRASNFIDKKQQRSRTQTEEETSLSFSKLDTDNGNLEQVKTSLNQRIPSNKRQKLVMTPYRIRRGSDKGDKLKTQPKQDVQFNINLNINSINIIQQSAHQHQSNKQIEHQLSSEVSSHVRRSKQLLNEQKLKMFLNSNLAMIARRRKDSISKDLSEQRRIRSSSSKRLSADLFNEAKQPSRRKLSFFQSIYSSSSKKWNENRHL